MSGYDKKSGIFEITAKRLHFWYRRKDFPEGFNPDKYKSMMTFYAGLLRACGLEVLKVRGNYLWVRAHPGQVWEALSGTPPDPDHHVPISPYPLRWP